MRTHQLVQREQKVLLLSNEQLQAKAFIVYYNLSADFCDILRDL